MEKCIRPLSLSHYQGVSGRIHAGSGRQLPAGRMRDCNFKNLILMHKFKVSLGQQQNPGRDPAARLNAEAYAETEGPQHPDSS